MNVIYSFFFFFWSGVEEFLDRYCGFLGGVSPFSLEQQLLNLLLTFYLQARRLRGGPTLEMQELLALLGFFLEKLGWVGLVKGELLVIFEALDSLAPF